MLTPEQQAMWKDQERDIRDGLAGHLDSLIRACDTINPLIEKAIGGLENAGTTVVTYHMTLAQARMELKLLADHQERFTAAMNRT